VLVHGLDSGPGAFANLRAALGADGFSVAAFAYPNDGPLRRAAEQFSRRLAALAERRPRLRLTLVAHSMGGLISRRMIEDARLNPGNVDRLLLMAVPHAGSRLAELRWLAELGRALSLEDTLSDGLGEAGRDLTPGSAFLRDLAGRRPPEGVRYEQLVGTGGPFTAERWRGTVARIADRLDRRGVSDWARARIVGTLKGMKSARKGLGDEAVSVESATLDHAPAPTKVAFSHREIQRLKSVEPVSEHPVYRWVVSRVASADE